MKIGKIHLILGLGLIFLAMLLALAQEAGAQGQGEAPGPVIYDGYLSRYNWGPTVYTLLRGQGLGTLPQELAQVQALLAVSNCGLVGYQAVLEAPPGEFHRALIFDCGGDDGGHNWMLRNGIAAEAGAIFASQKPEAIHQMARVTVIGHYSWGWGWPAYVSYSSLPGVETAVQEWLMAQGVTEGGSP